MATASTQQKEKKMENTKMTREELIEDCRQEAIRVAGGEFVLDYEGEIYFDASDWEPTDKDMEWVEEQLKK